MIARRRLAWVLVLAALSRVAATEDGPSPIDRGLGYLAREVPRWSRENRCYSCHNNGDAARALLLARQVGLRVAPDALEDTRAWLLRPDDWDHNGGEGPFSDKRLARIQFAATLAATAEAGDDAALATLRAAAGRLADEQQPDGSWTIDGPDAIGSPATLGRPLATWLAISTLRAAGLPDHLPRIEKAETWLRGISPVTTLDAAARLLVAPDGSEADRAARGASLERLCVGQSEEGGWGPYVTSPPEPFDTAVALLALARAGEGPEAEPRIRRGRDYLIRTQQADGSWVETTRPAGAESYAQRVSTTGWAVQALIATGSRPPRRPGS